MIEAKVVEEDNPNEETKDNGINNANESTEENVEWTKVTNSIRDKGKSVVNEGTSLKC